MKRAEADRRIKTLKDFHRAVCEVLMLTDFMSNETGYHRTARPQPGREREWQEAKAKADRLVAGASRSYLGVGATISYKPRGTFDQVPVDPARSWATMVSDDPMFGSDLLDTMTNQAIGAYEDLVADPPKPSRVNIKGISLPAWLSTVAYTAAGGVIAAGVIYGLDWG